LEPELRARITAEATVSPSEDADRVLRAVLNIFPDKEGEVYKQGETVWYISEDIRSLKSLREQFRDRHIRGAARRLALVARENNSTRLMLNRQAAAAGVAVVCGSPEESPLGPIYLTLESDRIDAVIDWLTAYESG
jgi:predicted RNA binding protein with dsRBD fold (UPF0201 family)